MTADQIQAALFDLDGVLTDTASIHSAAWKQLFDDFLARRGKMAGKCFAPFTRNDYLRYVDGLPRLDGIRRFLMSRGIELAEGEPGEALESDTVHSLGEHKNRLFLEVLAHEPVPVLDGNVEWVKLLRKHAVLTGVVSSSRNCERILELAGLVELFDICVDGITLAERHLAGKPAPDLFLAAANELGARPSQTLVVEDAIAGVQAGRDGHFGLVIGIASRHDRETLRNNGANIVVSNLMELTLEQLSDWFSQPGDRATVCP